jgi:glutaredoxin
MKPLYAIALILVAGPAFAQDAYRWVDKDGQVHYGDVPPSPTETKAVEPKRLEASVIDSGGKLPYDTRQAMQDFPVVLYVSTACGPACDAARDFLRKRNIPFAEKDVGTPANADALKKATGSNELPVPTLLVGDKPQTGFQDAAWGDALDAAGYPSGR